jgi:UDP-N-acetylmuramyl pentapeptide phosphotransferase/UDP-N-acetylglucosamine-1-phosphate transferase
VGGLLLLLAVAAALFSWWVFDALDNIAPGNDPSPVASWIGAASLVLAVLTGTLGLVLVLSRGARERLVRERQFERFDDG